VVVHPSVQAQLDRLASEAGRRAQPAQAIWKGFRAAIDRIKLDGQWGEVIPPRSIPREFQRAFGVTNLYCVDLPSFHRLFYTIRDRDVIVIGLVDHREYDRTMRA
jgi:ParE toxin of type II toxin-antitoxin system, parDE